ncbi:MAG TPA: 3-oxoacyl-[acyl-carrier-protein] synthase III C-terminal domain-containing protein [Kofleriaceae bacterium]|nr:3-oxoacyl-[acyl-carrier-protein] synthase III C-terminal domain-containing protein [Kofleriaceae bacterium]
MAHQATRAQAPSATLTEGQKLTLAAMAEYAADPFRGSIERRILSPDMTASQMEAHAAREAIERAGVAADQIDVILSNSPAPDLLMVNNACVTHRLLGLPQRCLALGTDAQCNGLAHHYSLAAGLIAGGHARYVLSVHSATLTRLTPADEPHSAWFGDGAAAVVFGPVADGKGLLAAVHNAAGERCDALVVGAGPDKNYWDDGALTVHSVNRDSTRDMLFGMVDRGGIAVTEALARAGLSTSDVDFYATHQSTAWLTRASAKRAGLENTKTLVTFPMFGNMSSANIPFILAIAERERMIQDGSVIVTFAGGTGETWSSLVVRWGR